ncbi:hypothetical protein LJK88_18580 [Paenibacillus sp. P26]|nr:hypothetical protein LJK88_18580 [Paenibacillus sp. P26]UUZ96264.1 hypothetical protein LJK87_19240 [Paenibacillus sp. P25]
MTMIWMIIIALLIALLAAVIGRGQSFRGGRSGHPPACQSRPDLSEAMTHIALIPYLDEHETVIAAGTDAVWRSLCEAMERSFSNPGMTFYARLVRSAYCTASGPRPFAEGSTFPGFRVVAAVPGRKLILEGCHYFSFYSMIFRLEDAGPGRTRLRAESRVAFPGLAGGLYRLLVIGTGGHVMGMRRLLSTIRRRSE